MQRLLLVPLALALVSSCAIGAPPGFNSADSWSIPIAQPLDDSTLLVPVVIEGKGPFLFALNTDWHESSIDIELASALGLRLTRTREALTSQDNLVREVRAEVKSITIGDLSVARPQFKALRAGHRPYPGLLVHGNIGRDILADSLTLTVDRDKGMVYLATAGHGPRRGEETRVVKLQKRSSMSWRLLAKAQVGGDSKLLFLDLANQQSTIRPLGTPGEPTSVSLAGVEEQNLRLREFADRRVKRGDYDGSLGQDFLARYRVSIDFNRKQLWLDTRASSLAEGTSARLQRWGTELSSCANPACVKIEIAPVSQDPESGAWLPTRLILTRELVGMKDYEVFLEPTFEDGPKSRGGLVRVTLPSGIKTLTQPLSSAFEGLKSFELVDVSPFPRACREGHCMAWVSLPGSRAAPAEDM